MQGEALAVGLALEDVVGHAVALAVPLAVILADAVPLAVTLADAVPEADAVNEGVAEKLEEADVPPALELG